MKSVALRQGNTPPVSDFIETAHSTTLPFVVYVLAAPLVGARLTTMIRSGSVPGCAEVTPVSDAHSLINSHADSMRHGGPQRNVALVSATSGWDSLTTLWMWQKPLNSSTVLALEGRHPNTCAQIAAATAQGVRVFVATDDTQETLSNALRAAAQGQVYTSNRLRSVLRGKTSRNDMEKTPSPKIGIRPSSHDNQTMSWVALSERQREVALLAAEGLSNGEIAERLFIDITTVKTHLGEVFRKMGICRRSQLVHHMMMVL